MMMRESPVPRNRMDLLAKMDGGQKHPDCDGRENLQPRNTSPFGFVVVWQLGMNRDCYSGTRLARVKLDHCNGVDMVDDSLG